jgi:hypothetical protein
MNRNREAYRFSLEDRQYARDRANGFCEYGGFCPRPNTNRVNHITGIQEAIRIGMRPEDVRDPRQNATMECTLHEWIHDKQEVEHLASLPRRGVIYERKH